MNFAIILAGGSGIRVGAKTPKQFLLVNDKPIFVYTIERFEQHPLINSIVIVCKEGWEDIVRKYIKQFNLNKIISIIPGGISALESIRNGISALSCNPEDIIIVHEAVRPMVEAEMISDVIQKSQETGAAMSVTPLKEHIFYSTKEGTVSHYYPRENAYRSASPQAYRYSTIIKAFENAEREGIDKVSAFSSTLVVDTGQEIALSYGSDSNFKITTKQDFDLFDALIRQRENNKKRKDQY